MSKEISTQEWREAGKTFLKGFWYGLILQAVFIWPSQIARYFINKAKQEHVTVKAKAVERPHQ